MPCEALSLRRTVRALHPNAAVAWAIFVTGVVLVTLLHLFQNGTSIDHKEVWEDEASTYIASRYPVARLVWLVIREHSQPPLYYLIVHFVSRLSGSEVVLRGLSWLFCLLLLYFVLFAMNELHLAARFVFAVGVVFSGYTHYLAQELRPYALAALTTLVSSVLLVRLLDEPRSGRRFALYLGSALLMLASLAFDVWVIVAHGIYCALVIGARARERGRLAPAVREHRLVILALAVAGALYLPYVIAAGAATGGPINGPLNPKHPLADRLLDMVKPGVYRDVFTRYAGTPATAAAGLQLGLALSAVVVRLRRRDPLPVLLLLLFFGQIVFVRAFLFGAYGASPRYYTPAFPVFFWCVAIGADHLLGAGRRFAVVPGLLAMALLTYTGAPAFAAYLDKPVPRPNWRRLYDETRVIPGKKAFFADHGGYAQMLEYIARNDHDYVFFTNLHENVPHKNISLAGRPMTKAYIEASVQAAAADTSCFFYMNNKRGKDTSLYDAVFVPEMEDLGFEEAFHSTSSAKLADPFHDWFDVVGFCRPE
jgi:hypothetical protein